MPTSNANAAGDRDDTLLLSRRNLYIGVLLVLVGLGAILVFSFFAPKGGVGVFAVSASVALGALAFGLFLGFLFGIPRTAALANGDDAASQHQVNTNLQDISDWLTKIIVGVSLVEFGNLVTQLGAIASHIQGNFPDVSGMDSFILGIIVLYFMTGLLFGFLWTRLELQGLIGLSDRSLLGRLRARIVQENADANLLELVAAVADPQLPPPAADVLAEAIVRASIDTRRLVFYRGREFRRNCVSSGNLANLNRVIPLFQGLVDADKAEFGGDGRYHRNYGQLAYSHKDRPEHSYDKAIELLTTAIKLRDTAGKDEAKYYKVYEFNRAYSRIMLDTNFAGNRVSDPSYAALVIADLEVAIKDSLIDELANADHVVVAWLNVNGLKIENGVIFGPR